MFLKSYIDVCNAYLLQKNIKWYEIKIGKILHRSCIRFKKGLNILTW